MCFSGTSYRRRLFRRDYCSCSSRVYLLFKICFSRFEKRASRETPFCRSVSNLLLKMSRRRSYNFLIKIWVKTLLPSTFSTTLATRASSSAVERALVVITCKERDTNRKNSRPPLNTSTFDERTSTNIYRSASCVAHCGPFRCMG